ncbi:MAG: type II toxin-antitoxin system RelE/ParE family toxin [Verrucomicrobiales bacterium]|nr:type II toxin-antitoxin system RelE/ParE family toxin [Verrucomicrobiales bacterium]
MIQSFADADTEQLFHEERNRRFNAIARVALRKLIQMNRAGRLNDLSIPPDNRLEALKGDLAGLHSIRINQQWRIVFRWTDQGPAEVRIADYH